jgi:hypothetical protein
MAFCSYLAFAPSVKLVLPLVFCSTYRSRASWITVFHQRICYGSTSRLWGDHDVPFWIDCT